VPTRTLRVLAAILLLFSVLSLMLVGSASAASRQEVATSLIAEAEHAIVRAYEVVLGAERAGANVSALLIDLTDAAGLAADARMVFEAGDFEEAIRCAELSLEVGDWVEEAAAELEVDAVQAHAERVWWFVGVSVLGGVVVLCGALVGYRYFKRFYYRRLLKLRPRVG